MRTLSAEVRNMARNFFKKWDSCFPILESPLFAAFTLIFPHYCSPCFVPRGMDLVEILGE